MMIKVIYSGNYSDKRKLKNELARCNAFITNGSQKLGIAYLFKDGRAWYAFCPNWDEDDVEYTIVEFFGNNIKQVKYTIEQRVKALVTKDNFYTMNPCYLMDLNKVKVYRTTWKDLLLNAFWKQMVLR